MDATCKNLLSNHSLQFQDYVMGALRHKTMSSVTHNMEFLLAMNIVLINKAEILTHIAVS